MTEPTIKPIEPEVSVSQEVSAATNNRRNLGLMGGLMALLLIFGGGYFFWAKDRVDGELADREARALEVMREFEASQPTPTRAPRTPTPVPVDTGPVEVVPQPGEVVFVNRAPGDDYGRMGVRHVDGTRTLFERKCLRVHLNAGNGVCLSEVEGVLPSYETTFFEADSPRQEEIKSYASALPSRARISPDGSVSTVTAFVNGSSYEDIGGGETSTIVTVDEIETGNRLRGASQFVVDSADPKYDGLDPQYWGLSFANNDEFFITGFYTDKPEIMSGSLDELTVAPTGWIGSCPSLSPDGKTLVFKQARDDGAFDLVAVDIATDVLWKLGETRSVDDQVEWLDNDTILYAVHPEGGDTPVQPEFDIWMLDIAEGSEPVLFLPNADSPATIR